MEEYTRENPMMRNRFVPAAAGFVLILTACSQGGHEPDKKAEDDDALPVPVEISQPTRGDVYAVYAGTAPIEAYAEADVIAKVAGEVREILVEEGDDVVQGQILARLDGDKLRLELNESAARLQKLKRDYERNVDLKAKGLISTGDFDKIRYEMDALEASYNLAKLELDYTQIRAPITGVISERFIRNGKTLAIGDPVFRVTSFEPLVAYLHVPEKEYRNIDEGQRVAIEIDAIKGQSIFASVTRVSPIVDPATGTFKITIEISDAERRIKPGMFGRFAIVYDKHENALQIPRSALLEDDGNTSVFVVVENKAIRRTVTTGYSNKGLVEVIDGLDDDDQVISVGQVGLKEDALVTIINAPDPVPQETETASAEVSEDATPD
jgi:membrane fusion protein, multidrug efflux system